MHFEFAKLGFIASDRKTNCTPLEPFNAKKLVVLSNFLKYSASVTK